MLNNGYQIEEKKIKLFTVQCQGGNFIAWSEGLKNLDTFIWHLKWVSTSHRRMLAAKKIVFNNALKIVLGENIDVNVFTEIVESCLKTFFVVKV